jgi:predicted nucleic acid-binding Zn ribbon protein
LTTNRRSAAGRPQPLSDVLARYLDRSGLAPKLEAASVIPEWEERVGPQIAAVTEPVRVSDGTLFVAVSTSAWMMELNLMKAQLMRRINAGKGEGRISALVFLMSGQETDRPAPVRRN